MASGANTLYYNTAGNYNTAVGNNALQTNTTGSRNAANGLDALSGNTTGSETQLSASARLQVTPPAATTSVWVWEPAKISPLGDNNIDIGNPGVADESNAIRIGIEGYSYRDFIAGINGVSFAGAVPVVIDANGQLGTGDSRVRVGQQVQPDRLVLGATWCDWRNPVQMELTEPMEHLGRPDPLARQVWQVRLELPVRPDRQVRLERWTLVTVTRLGVMGLS